MSTIKDRLIQYLDAKEITKAKFGRTIGVSNAYITSIKHSISQDKLQKIAKEYPDLSLKWLVTGDGEMLITEKKAPPIVDISNVDQSFNSTEEATIAHLTKIIEEQRKRIDYLTDKLLEKQ